MVIEIRQSQMVFFAQVELPKTTDYDDMPPDVMIETVNGEALPKYVEQLNPMDVNIVEVDYGNQMTVVSGAGSEVSRA